MSLWCGILFVVTASFSLNALYHDLFSGRPLGTAIPTRLLGSLQQPVRNGAMPGEFRMEFISPAMFNLHHPFTALLPVKQALDVQIGVKQDKMLTETVLKPCVETEMTVMETGLMVIETGRSVMESIKINPIQSEDNEEDIIIRNEESGESFPTCPVKVAVSIKPTHVKEKREISSMTNSVKGFTVTLRPWKSDIRATAIHQLWPTVVGH
ncbi:uncharacterized protein [Narcine bancroftii]|uniref:uncharacterized protein isoform X2 n=1 Tax=Narcine bancroftii TaxID=1343680 RepID=UPI0038320CCB